MGSRYRNCYLDQIGGMMSQSLNAYIVYVTYNLRTQQLAVSRSAMKDAD